MVQYTKMAHIIRIITCKKGHTDLSLTLDSNECGCHHNGDPCLIISCNICFIEALKNNTPSYEGKIYIPINNHILKELNIK